VTLFGDRADIALALAAIVATAINTAAHNDAAEPWIEGRFCE